MVQNNCASSSSPKVWSPSFSSSSSPPHSSAVPVPGWPFLACASMSPVGLGFAVEVSSEDTGLWTSHVPPAFAAGMGCRWSWGWVG